MRTPIVPTLSHYEILEKLGSGGMGEVYRAHDIKLDREVAIKLLPEELAGDSNRLRRFEQEARAASSIDHPNIVTIFDIVEAGGRHFIVMQLVDGATLAELIRRRKGLELRKLLDYAIQIADGLAAAHARGIVHRDLKPDNVMLTPDGRIKILDFGLAKLVEPADPSEAATRGQAQPRTDAGRVLGTAPYMSPEQALGHSVDARSDIFSFGSVLYEMLTGRRAFDSDSVPELLTAIIREEPTRVSELVSSLPFELERVIQRTMRKEPERRFQSMADVRVELQEVEDALDSGRVVTAEQLQQAEATPARKTRLWTAGASLAAASLLLGWLYISRFDGATPPASSAPLTTFEGSETQPALSPDGTLVAYVWDQGGSRSGDLYVQLVGSPEPVRLTHGEGEIRDPAFSPDGREIAFLQRGEDRKYQVVVLPALGGGRRALALLSGVNFAGLDWSPRDDLVAVVDAVSDPYRESIFVISTDTGEKRQLTSVPSSGMGDRNPVFSPDGTELAFVRWREAPRNEIHVQPVGGGEPTCLAILEGYIRDLAWLPDGSGLAFSLFSEGATDLWKVTRSGGKTTRLFIGGNPTGISISRTGQRLVYESVVRDTNIWRVGGPSSPEAPPERFIASTRDDWAVQFSPDGTRIAFTSDRSGQPQIWIGESDGTNCRRMPMDHMASWPRWSPDGERIAFAGTVDGNVDVFVSSVQGGFPIRLTSDPGMDVAWSWSHDGRFIYFASERTGAFEVWRIPGGGGPSTRLTNAGGVLPLASEDGQFLYYLKLSPPLSIWRMPADGGPEQLVLDEHVSLSGFTLWRGRVVYVRQDDREGPSIESFDPRTKQRRTIAALGKETLLGWYGRISVSPDGRFILFPRQEGRGSDLMLVEDFR